jgi:DNA-directed RNA polymerase specialized sigma24 family protein
MGNRNLIVDFPMVQATTNWRRTLKMLGTNHIAQHDFRAYANSADFCRIFERDMNRLYLLAFLLTADHVTAEKCFVSGMEESKNGNLVFKDWAQSWARRLIILNAIRMIHPRPQLATADHRFANRSGLGEQAGTGHAAVVTHLETFSEELRAIIALPAFQRFAFVMSVLEGYSNRETSLLLDCSVTELVAARTYALQQIGGRPELHRKLAGMDATKASLAEAGAAYVNRVMSLLATPA